MCYHVYGEIGFDGTVNDEGVRKSEVRRSKSTGRSDGRTNIDAVKYRDHVMITIDDGREVFNVIFALPDSTRYAYIGLTGTNCHIYDVKIHKDESAVGEGYIPRIAEEISFISGPAGDIPNVQIDGWRSASTEGIEIDGDIEVKFRSMSLPTARLLWHCPFVILFYSEDGKMNGPGFMEFALMRMDGEGWEMHEGVETKIAVNKEEEFEDWDSWKARQKQGVDCTVRVRRKDNTITVLTRNEGVNLKDTTRIDLDPPKIYFALSGDQCAITDIHINRES